MGSHRAIRLLRQQAKSMGARLYVGNLAYETREDGLKQLVEDGGYSTADIHIVTDRATGRSRGFAFVELANDSDLQAAIGALDGATLDGRRLSVSEARPRKPREGAPVDRRGAGAGRPPRGDNSFQDRGTPRGAEDRGRGDRNNEPERHHRRPRFDGPDSNRPRSDRPPRRDGPPPHVFNPPPPDPPLKEDGRRRNKKWKDKERSEDRDSGRGRDLDRGGRKRRGGGRRGEWDDEGDW